MSFKQVWVAIAAACSIGSANAELFARDLDLTQAGFEGVYDDVRNITWLADALAAGGNLNYYEAQSWAAGLVVGGNNGWRVATEGELVSSYFDWQTATQNQYGYFYTSHPEFANTDGFGSNAGFGSRLFKNAWVPGYYLGDLFGPDAMDVPYFSPYAYDGGGASPFFAAAAWAVHTGDIAVAPVPEPDAYALMLAGVVTLWAVRRRAKRA
jgi:hypothetical protein